MRRLDEIARGILQDAWRAKLEAKASVRDGGASTPNKGVERNNLSIAGTSDDYGLRKAPEAPNKKPDAPYVLLTHRGVTQAAQGITAARGGAEGGDGGEQLRLKLK